MKHSQNQKRFFYSLGAILLLFGIYLSIFQKQAHFYTFFAVGFLIIFWLIYNSISKKKLFQDFKIKHHVFFWVILTLICIIIDTLCMFLGWWIYPSYSSGLDEILKYIFEWVIPLAGSMILFMIGLKHKTKKVKLVNLVIALALVFVFGIFTEFINLFAFSWKILSMPITNLKIGPFFLIFQTIGYWLMALITLCIYHLTKKIFKIK